jgi:hypothetical protein
MHELIGCTHHSHTWCIYIFFVMNHYAYAWPLAAMNARRRRTSVRGALPCPRGDVRGWDRGRARHTRAIPPSTTQERGRERPVPRAAAHNGASRDLPRPHRPAELYSTQYSPSQPSSSTTTFPFRVPCACECDTATDPLRPASRLPPPPVTTTLGQVAICLPPPPPPPHRPTLPTTHGVAAIVAVSLCALPRHSATISVSPVPPPAPGGSLSLTVRTWLADCTQSGRRCLAATRRTARHRQGDLCSPSPSRGDTG